MKKTNILIICAFVFFKLQAQTVTDFDGNTYNTIAIGTQVWMQENLKVTHFNNGTAIPNVTDDADWAALTTPAYCNYDNIPAHADTYGRLYNWFTVNSTHKVCPTGWHVPSAGEWKTMLKFLDPTVDTTAFAFGNVGTDIGGQLKETGTTHWFPPNTGATNSSGFTALPSGTRMGSTFVMPGIFGNMGYQTAWWSSTENLGYAVAIGVYYSDAFASITDIDHISRGYAIRCIKDVQNAVNNNDTPLNTIEVYPNPSPDMIYFSGVETNVHIQVFNALGKLVFENEMLTLPNKLDISNFSKGVYFIHLKQNNFTKIQKFIKN